MSGGSIKFIENADATNLSIVAQIQSNAFTNDLRTGLMVTDGHGTVIACNKSAQVLLELSHDQLLTSSPYDADMNALHDDGSHFCADQFTSSVVLRTGEPHLGVMVGISFPGKKRRWMWEDGYPIFVDGQLAGAAICFDDITDFRQNRQSLRLMNEVNRIVMLDSNEHDPLQRLCDVLVESGHYPLAWVGFLSDNASGDVEVAFASGATDYLTEGMISVSGAKINGLGPTGTALRTGTSQVADEIASSEFFSPWRERAAEFQLKSSVAVPFAPGGKRGVLSVYDWDVFAFDQEIVEGLESIAREMEFSVGHIRSVEKLRTALDGTLTSLGYMTEARDPYTAGHQSRVGLLGAAIAKHIGVDARIVELIRQSGDVHDIGKIAIPTEILTRPGRLSALEYEMIKAHPTVGFEILTKASVPWPIAEVARDHHERMDGSGYPSGLLASEIILPARIIAVADVVEAMAHHRPYRAALGMDAALAEITRGSGTLFDSDVVESCRAVIEAGFSFAWD